MKKSKIQFHFTGLQVPYCICTKKIKKNLLFNQCPLVLDKVLAALGGEIGSYFFGIHFHFRTVCLYFILFLNPKILGLKHTSLFNISLHIAWLLLPSGTMNNEFARAVLVNKAKKPFVGTSNLLCLKNQRIKYFSFSKSDKCTALTQIFQSFHLRL